MQTLPELQPGDSVQVKLDQQRLWKTPGKVIARRPVPRSYIIQTPNSVVRRNRRQMRTVNSPAEECMMDKSWMLTWGHGRKDQLRDLNILSRKNYHRLTLQAVWRQRSEKLSLLQTDVRTSSGRIVRERSPFKDFIWLTDRNMWSHIWRLIEEGDVTWIHCVAHGKQGRTMQK